MNFDNLQKVIASVMVIIALATIGLYINRATVTQSVAITSKNKTDKYIKVTVSGEVKSPGEYRVKEGTRICDIIYSAGGITSQADVQNIDLDAIATDKMVLKIPSAHDEIILSAIPVVNINTADFKTMCLIPGIGETLAQRIIDYRKENGKFYDVSDIMKVNGIGEKTFEEIKDYIKTEETQK